MQRFRTKSEMLKHLGKNGEDRRYIDRKLASGEIVLRDGLYWLGREYIMELEKEVENLKQERDKNTTQVMNKDDKMSSDSDLIDHIRYLYIRNEMRDECIKKLVGLYYNKNTAAWWDAAMEKTYQLIWFEVDPDEGAELEYIRSII